MASTNQSSRKSQIPKPAAKGTDTVETRVVRKARKSHEGITPGLSLQGPFNPNIVAAVSAKHGDRIEEPKRKRDGNKLSKTKSSTSFKVCSGVLTSGTNRRSSGHDGTERRRVSGGKSRSPGSGDFLSVHNPDVPLPKRNQVKEQQKCKVEYSTRANTAFTSSETAHPKFTASATNTRTTRDHHKPTATKGYRELQKSEELLQKKVANLEIKVKGLEQLQKKASNLEKENVDLRRRLNEEETTHKETTEKLESKIDNCMKKLEDCRIDPVTLEEDDSPDEQTIQTKQREAQESCQELTTNMSRMKEQCKEILTDINNIVDEE